MAYVKDLVARLKRAVTNLLTFYLACIVQFVSKLIHQIINGIFSRVQFIFSKE